MQTKLYRKDKSYPVIITENPRVIEQCQLLNIDGRILTWRRPDGTTHRTTAPTTSKPQWWDKVK